MIRVQASAKAPMAKKLGHDAIAVGQKNP